MTDLEVAQQIKDGILPSPYKFANFTYFALRMTGTGLSYRSARKEVVWRDPSIYLNETFLQRCAAVPVIWEHPEGKSLDSEEFNERIIGTIALAYIVEDSVWVICRIYDAEAVRLMSDDQLSTSPAVVFQPTDGNTTQEIEGLTILVEGTPSLICHLAICGLGVWDKTGPPRGVQNDLIPTRTDSARNDTMADETEAQKKEREDKERGDATNINMKLMDAVESLAKRFDAMEKDRKDEKEREETDRRDTARRDAKSRRDAERTEWEKEDARHCAAEDAQEAAECDAMKKDGMGEEEATDKARKDRRARMDVRRRDAAAEEEKKKTDKEREDAARMDSVEAIKKLVRETVAGQQRSDTDAAAISAEQARFDSVHIAFGERAPQPMVGETTADYQIRMARGFQKHSKRWKDTNLAVLDAATRAVVVGDICNDAVEASRSDEMLPAGKLIPRTYANASGHQITEFRGRDSIFKTFSAPTQAVLKFNTEKRA